MSKVTGSNGIGLVGCTVTQTKKNREYSEGRSQAVKGRLRPLSRVQ